MVVAPAGKKKIRLPNNELAKRNLPLKPDPVSLYGKYVTIMPFDKERDAKELFNALNGSPIKKPNKSIEVYDQDNLV